MVGDGILESAFGIFVVAVRVVGLDCCHRKVRRVLQGLLQLGLAANACCIQCHKCDRKVKSVSCVLASHCSHTAVAL